MRFWLGTFILCILAAALAWQCITLPSMEMGGWTLHENTADAELALVSGNAVHHPPGSIEIAVRVLACTIGLLVGLKLIRAVAR
jgi:hypothetical protein